MNKIRNIVLCGLALCMASCVQDLNTKPIDPNAAVNLNVGALFTKIYATLATTGQTGAAGSGDLDDIDEGVSAFYRVMWELNEFPTDEGWWIWNDAGVDVARTMGWDGENTLVKGLYYRFIIDIKYCNHFLFYTQEPQDVAANWTNERAEVRFIRALNYWYLLDMFRFIPYIEKESTDPNDYPEFKSRKEMFEWLEAELTELTTELPANRLSKYRVDQTAAWLLLSRLYLNAEVYAGEAKWKEARDAADMAINSSYKLHTGNITNKENIVYTAYQQLFMGDNDINGAQDEAVLLVYQDGKYCQAYGGSQFCIAANRDGGMLPWGCSANWKCFRTSPEMVYKFFNQYEAENVLANEYNMREFAKDDRAIFCSYIEGKSDSWKLTGGMAADFYASWACPKFTAVYSTADSLSIRLGSDSEFADTDIPLIRIAEAYLTKAEAMFRLGDVSGAMNLINSTIRERAEANPLTSLDEATLCDEWCREFWGEGRRRTDLVRFNRFAGPQADANAYHWEGRGNSGNFKSMEEKWNWFPVPSDDKKTNPNYKLQVLNDKGADMIGGDGYDYVTGE